jgi:hypothetical protein
LNQIHLLIGHHTARIDAVERRPVGGGPAPKYRAVARMGRVLGHTHGVEVDIEEVK